VYATGKSDGGGLAAQLACKAADAITAAAPVAGAYYPIAGGCRPARAVAIAEFHGTGDRVVPYAGSVRRELPDIDTWLAAWALRDGCTRVHAPSTVAAGIWRHRWTGCRGGSVVEGFKIGGGGHTWPGPSGPGTTPQRIVATALIAGFFGLSRIGSSDDH
jgi:polyhydroxybutyrate depolymerase